MRTLRDVVAGEGRDARLFDPPSGNFPLEYPDELAKNPPMVTPCRTLT